MSGKQVPQDKIDQVKPIAFLGGIMIAISVIAIIAACLTKCIKHCICVWIEIPVLFIISVVLIVFGSLLTVPANGGAEFVDTNCQLAAAGKLDDMDGNVRKVFEPIADFDR